MSEVTKEQLEQIVKECKQYSDIIRKLNWKKNGNSRKKLMSLLNIYNISVSHFVRYSFIEIECPNCKNNFSLNLAYYNRRKSKGQKTFCCSQSCSSKILNNLGFNSQKGTSKQEQMKLKLKQNAIINPDYGMRGKNHKEDSIKKIIESLIGRPKSKETIDKHRQSNLGENNWNWLGGITPLNEQIRHCNEYDNWRNLIFKRDSYLCQDCKDPNKNYLNAHHIKEFNIIMKENNIQNFDQALSCQELWSLENGITLCEDCHDKIPKKKKRKLS